MTDPAFASLVRDRPDPTLDPATCPCRHCGRAGPLVEAAHCATLLAGLLGNDPNHHWRTLACPACDGLMYVETKSGNSWETAGPEGGDRKLLRGVPTCYESYTYTCASCGGDVTRDHRSKVTGEPTTSLLTTPEGRQYTTHFACGGCEASVESPQGYWGDWDGTPRQRPSAPPNFTAKQVTGVSVGNTAGLSRVDFG